MATKFNGSLRLPKKPKQPKVNGSATAWDAYEKRLSEYNKRKTEIEREKARRQKIKDKAR